MLLDLILYSLEDLIIFVVNAIPINPVALILPQQVVSGFIQIVSTAAYFLPLADLVFFMTFGFMIKIFRIFFTLFFRIRELIPIV